MTHGKTDDAAGSGLSMVDVEKALIPISDELVILQSQLAKLIGGERGFVFARGVGDSYRSNNKNVASMATNKMQFSAPRLATYKLPDLHQENNAGRR
jgi:hypothetical protein